MSRLKDHYVREIKSQMGSADYLVFINGLPKIYDNSYVYARIRRSGDEPELEFYIKYKVAGKPYHDIPKNLKNSVLNECTSGDLMGFKFNNFVNSETFDIYGGVSSNNSLKILFLESPMFYRFKTQIPKRENLNIVFGAKQDNGATLTANELLMVLNIFRVNGFNSILEIERVMLGSRIQGKTNKFYKIGDAFTLASLKVPQLYNPLFDDMILYNTISNTKFMKAIVDRTIESDELGVTYAMLSNEHIRQFLNLDVLVPFNFQILTRVVAGAIMPGDYLPISYPSLSKTVYVLNSAEEGMKKFISLYEYNDMDDYEKGFYSPTSAMSAFIMRNQQFFQMRGFRDTMRLMEVFEDLALI